MSPLELRHDDPDDNDSLDAVIDRVVDGELSSSQLREAIARIEASHDGWRRCALAFIESQCLGQILREADEVSVTVSSSGRTVLPFQPRRGISAVRRLALAASLAALAFGLGWIGRGGIGARQGAPGVDAQTRPMLASNVVETRDAIVTTPEPSHEGSTIRGTRNAPLRFDDELAQADSDEAPTFDDSPTPLEVSFEDWVRAQPPAISSYDQALLECEGYQVEQRREVLFGSLEDGRLAAVPVDEVELKYVGHVPL
ncbi:MAG: hypothetical protein ABS79_03100 [Planctomycetes bacterium SCN 63-9]|nr:MAG: hypothetical protein ABS79_03100 [Planctomycetes bacterium SCN 63-9]